METRGKNLLFIISQPRSGSTLLQHMLASHSQVHSLPEPWFLLHMVYAMRSQGISTEYNANIAHKALNDFLGRVPDGKQAYIEAIRNAAATLYSSALKDTGKTIYLDKTPRYFLIIPELLELFPEAKFVFLIRNPLAVLSSKIERLGDRPAEFTKPDALHDLYTAPQLILDGYAQAGDRAALVHYETLVADPVATLQQACATIDLPYEPEMIDYGSKVRFNKAELGDQGRIYQHDRPVADYAESWWSRFDTPAKARLVKSYLEAVGAETIEAMGYSYDDLMQNTCRILHDQYRNPAAWARQWSTCRTACRVRRVLTKLRTRISSPKLATS